MSIFGVDYTAPYLNAARLRANGVKFVCRYLCPAGSPYTWKRMTKAEASVLRLAKIDIVGVWETSAGRAKLGFAAGSADAMEALAHLRELGAPANAPIYFAVDFDAAPHDQPQINAYFDGVRDKIALERIGAYGGYYVVQRLFNAQKITYGWQTRAWSGGQWESRAQLQQYGGGKIGGFSVDYNRALKDDFGQWRRAKPDTGKKYLIEAVNKDGSDHWLPVNRVGASYEMSRFLAGNYESIKFSRGAKNS